MLTLGQLLCASERPPCRPAATTPLTNDGLCCVRSERYGAGGFDSPYEYDAANKQAAWVAERHARGVGVTGQYVFNAGSCPETGRARLLDAEDPMHANWTRFINHSARRPNLAVEYGRADGGDSGGSDDARGGTSSTEGSPPSTASADAMPIVRFVVSQRIDEGEEMLFDYGEGFELDVLDFED